MTFVIYDISLYMYSFRNPVGRTGMTGRGLLGKWGPNHAADPLVTRCDSLIILFVSKEQSLQFVGNTGAYKNNMHQTACPQSLFVPSRMRDG